MKKATRRRIGWVLVVLFPLNFLAFLTSSTILGGESFDGKREGVQWFVGNHGRFTPVSEGAYYYNLWQGIAAIASLPLAAFGGWLARKTD